MKAILLFSLIFMIFFTGCKKNLSAKMITTDGKEITVEYSHADWREIRVGNEVCVMNYKFFLGGEDIFIYERGITMEDTSVLWGIAKRDIRKGKIIALK